VYVTPAFPKLVYVLDECNCLKGGKYDYITKLAVRCSAKRMYPDYISAKKMRENYEGNVFSPMGCRSFLSPWKDENGNYKFEGRFNQGVVSINLPQIGILAKGEEEDFWPLLEERLAAQEQLFDSEDSYAYDYVTLQFDRAIVEAAGNDILLEVFDKLNNLFLLSIAWVHQKEKQKGLLEHRAILDAVRNHDTATVLRILDRHYNKHL